MRYEPSLPPPPISRYQWRHQVSDFLAGGGERAESAGTPNVSPRHNVQIKLYFCSFFLGGGLSPPPLMPACVMTPLLETNLRCLHYTSIGHQRPKNMCRAVLGLKPHFPKIMGTPNKGPTSWYLGRGVCVFFCFVFFWKKKFCSTKSRKNCLSCSTE